MAGFVGLYKITYWQLAMRQNQTLANLALDTIVANSISKHHDHKHEQKHDTGAQAVKQSASEQSNKIQDTSLVGEKHTRHKLIYLSVLKLMEKWELLYVNRLVVITGCMITPDG